ncbi:hypothetical protein F4777DRAFT_193630 [Nemania sp. FL0916]|nr:hypothetical protein F4777DRAFT_193630 [Nemania sp. FL0916]
MISLTILSVILFFMAVKSWQKLKSRGKLSLTEKDDKVQHLQSLAAHHEIAASLVTLINRDGAGQWPPRSSYTSWPEALQPYRRILREVLPSLAAAVPSLDDVANTERREKFRQSMENLLRSNVHLPSVIEILDEIEEDKWKHLSREALNGFFCCISLSRHAHRWAVTPVVKVAQLEEEVNLPPELHLPWSYLQRYFGFAADSGNHTSNVLLNFDENGTRMFYFNSTLPASIQSTEESFFRLLVDIETMGFDMFYEMVLATISFQEGRNDSCLESLKKIDVLLSQSLTLFHARMRETQISRLLWLSYVQGFHGWGVGRQIKDSFVRFNGVSGNHIVLFQVLDAFLGLDRYLPDEDMELYIPLHQRLLCETVKKYSIRQQLGDDDAELIQQFEKIVKRLRQYRAAHRSRVIPYLKQPAPERYHMTAGKSVLTTDLHISIDEAIAPLDRMLVARSIATI